MAQSREQARNGAFRESRSSKTFLINMFGKVSTFLLRRVAEQFVPKDVGWRSGKEHVGYLFTDKILKLKTRIIAQ